MTSVELVSNPELEVSTHSWTTQGIPQLTRENKVSSLPFWVPNDKMKRHQFRLVLLKGLVPAASAADDSYGLVMELVPPPADPQSSATATAAYPGGCYVTVRVASQDATLVADITGAQTVLMDESNAQVSFPELLPAAAALPAYQSGDPPAVTITVTIHTGVNVFAQQITSSVTSLWSTLTTSVSKLVDTTKKVYHEGRKEFEEAATELAASAAKASGPSSSPSSAGAAGAAACAPPPWEVVPAKWASRAEEWRALVCEKAVEDDGLFLHGPERSISEDERQLMLQAGFNYRLLVELYVQFDFDRDVHEGLLASDALRQQRYQLVPAKVKEGVFWANYFWKVACLATCENVTQVRTFLTVANAPPAAVPKRLDLAVTRLAEAEVMGCATDAQEAADLLLEYLSDANGEDDMFLMETAANTCEDHVRRLEPQFCRTDLPESTQLVVGITLRRLRERIAQYYVLEEAREAAARAKAAGTPLPPFEPTAEEEVSEEELEEVVQDDNDDDGTVRTPNRHTSRGEKEDEADTASSAQPAEASSPPAQSPSQQQHQQQQEQQQPRATSGSAPMVVFAKMPWEEEEDDA